MEECLIIRFFRKSQPFVTKPSNQLAVDRNFIALESLWIVDRWHIRPGERTEKDTSAKIGRAHV